MAPLPSHVGIATELPRAAEDELRRLRERNHVLETRVSSLEAALHAQNDCLVTVAHDLRSPLSAILLSLGSMRRHLQAGRKDEAMQAATIIRHSASYMRQLIESLLAKPEHPSVLRESAFDLPELLRVVVLTKSAAADQAGVHLACVVPGDLPSPACDGVGLERALGNLLDNAIRFSPPGGHVRVLATVQSRLPEPQLCISVTDEGPGIAAEDQAHIFERHWRASGQPSGGLGLGLYGAHQWAKRVGGLLSVESVPGLGAHFRVLLPLARPS